MAPVPFPRLREPPPHIAYPFKRELAACVDLLETVEGLLGRDLRPVPTERHASAAIHGEFVRGHNTYAAVLELCLFGYGVQAEMLLRPLFEAAVFARWTALHPEVADERYLLHGRFGQHLTLQALQKAPFPPPEPLPPLPEPVTDDELRQAEKWFGKRGEKNWTGLNFYEMACEAIDSMPSEEARKHLSVYLDIQHRSVNQTLHSGLIAASRGKVIDDDGRHIVTYGPSAIGVLQSLDAARNTYMLLVFAADDWFGWGWRPTLDAAFARVWRAFKYDEIKDVGRNDRCPCGSGKKFKQCHGG